MPTIENITENAVIVLCEESQAVVIALREKGVIAFSCDLLPCSGGHTEWHIVGDAIEVMNGGTFTLENGDMIKVTKWRGLIGFPPCTFMSKAGARWMYPTAGNICPERLSKAMEAKAFFLEMWNSGIEFISLENPQPMKVIGLPLHTQTVQPYEFGHRYSKKTFLWLKNLPPLLPTYFADTYKPYLPSNTGGAKRGQKFMYKSITQKESSKTFPGIAKAMAEQWGEYLINQKIQP